MLGQALEQKLQHLAARSWNPQLSKSRRATGSLESIEIHLQDFVVKAAFSHDPLPQVSSLTRSLFFFSLLPSVKEETIRKLVQFYQHAFRGAELHQRFICELGKCLCSAIRETIESTRGASGTHGFYFNFQGLGHLLELFLLFVSELGSSTTLLLREFFFTVNKDPANFDVLCTFLYKSKRISSAWRSTLYGYTVALLNQGEIKRDTIMLGLGVATCTHVFAFSQAPLADKDYEIDFIQYLQSSLGWFFQFAGNANAMSCRKIVEQILGFLFLGLLKSEAVKLMKADILHVSWTNMWELARTIEDFVLYCPPKWYSKGSRTEYGTSIHWDQAFCEGSRGLVGKCRQLMSETFTQLRDESLVDTARRLKKIKLAQDQLVYFEVFADILSCDQSTPGRLATLVERMKTFQSQKSFPKWCLCWNLDELQQAHSHRQNLRLLSNMSACLETPNESKEKQTQKPSNIFKAAVSAEAEQKWEGADDMIFQSFWDAVGDKDFNLASELLMHQFNAWKQRDRQSVHGALCGASSRARLCRWAQLHTVTKKAAAHALSLKEQVKKLSEVAKKAAVKAKALQEKVKQLGLPDNIELRQAQDAVETTQRELSSTQADASAAVAIAEKWQTAGWIETMERLIEEAQSHVSTTVQLLYELKRPQRPIGNTTNMAVETLCASLVKGSSLEALLSGLELRPESSVQSYLAPVAEAAAERGLFRALQVLAEMGFDANALIFSSEPLDQSFQAHSLTLLMLAAASGNVCKVKAYLQAGVDPNIPNPEGMTALLFACWRGAPDCAAVLWNASKRKHFAGASEGMKIAVLRLEEAERNIERYTTHKEHAHLAFSLATTAAGAWENNELILIQGLRHMVLIDNESGASLLLSRLLEEWKTRSADPECVPQIGASSVKSVEIVLWILADKYPKLVAECGLIQKLWISVLENACCYFGFKRVSIDAPELLARLRSKFREELSFATFLQLLRVEGDPVDIMWRATIAAAYRKDITTIQFFQKIRGFNIDALSQGSTPLMTCAKSDPNAVKGLLDAKADVNFENAQGVTAAMCACVGGSNECLQLLLQRGASPLLQCRESDGCAGRDLLSFALEMKRQDLIETCIRAGAPLHSQIWLEFFPAGCRGLFLSTPLKIAQTLGFDSDLRRVANQCRSTVADCLDTIVCDLPRMCILDYLFFERMPVDSAQVWTSEELSWVKTKHYTFMDVDRAPPSSIQWINSKPLIQ